MAITSAKAYHLPLQHVAQHLPWFGSTYIMVSIKIAGHTNTHTQSGVGKLLRLTYSPDLRKPCLKTGENVPANKI